MLFLLKSVIEENEMKDILLFLILQEFQLS